MPLPLLSGPPPRKSTDTCRKCSKKFNLILNRSRTCGHCGFSYCQEHCTHRALTPRQSDSFSLRGGGGSGSGYEEEHCCDFCIPFVRITSLEYERLETLSIKELKGYIAAYNIQVPLGLHEKSEFINLIFRSRTLNGCLNEIKEDYFREKTVPSAPSEAPPSTNVFTNFLNDLSDPSPSSQSSRRGSNTNSTRPSPSPQPQPNASSSSSRRPSAPQQQPASSRPPSQPSNVERTRPRPPPQNNQPRPTPPPPNRTSPNSRPTPPPPAPPRASPPPPQTQTHSQVPPVSATRPPTLTELITLQSQSSSLDPSTSIIPDLSVRILKSILSTHHVRSDGILEKSELVEKVVRLVREESERLRRMEVEERREAMEEAAAGVSAGRMSGEGEWEAVPEWILAEGRAAEEERVRRMNGGGGEGAGAGGDASTTTEAKEKKELPKPSPPAPKPPPAPAVERSGICVICCDRDAIIASVDCGHLALCSECSDMVMAGNRECPLCRTVMRPGPGLLRIYSS